LCSIDLCIPYVNALYFSPRGKIYKNGGGTWKVSDCEELVGVTHRRWWGWFCNN